MFSGYNAMDCVRIVKLSRHNIPFILIYSVAIKVFSIIAPKYKIEQSILQLSKDMTI